MRRLFWLGALLCACSANYENSSDAGSVTEAGPDGDHDVASSMDASEAKATTDAHPDSTLTCDSGATACTGSCVDLSTDPQHCGECTTACSANQLCQNGQCCATADETSGSTCTLYPQCGCLTAQMCTSTSTGTYACVAAGTSPSNSPCASQGQCAPGLGCTADYCEPWCISKTDCAANWDCIPQFFGSVPAGSVCVPHCNPVATFSTDSTHQPCNTGQQCLPLLDAQGQTACYDATGTGVQGAACTVTADCAANYYCPVPPGVCEHYCRIGFSDCTTGTCTAFSTAVYDGTQEIGVCQ